MVVTDRLRAACAEVSRRSRSVHVVDDQIEPYAAGLTGPAAVGRPLLSDLGVRRSVAWEWLALDAVNFGSGWFPTLKKGPGGTGYTTIAAGMHAHGAWTAAELRAVTPESIAALVGQQPEHELMGLFAASLNDLGTRVEDPLELAELPALRLVGELAGWSCFADESRYEELSLPFLKRAQILCADWARAGVAQFEDLDRLTLFADNLVPHVLRLDGVLRFDPDLVARIEAGELIEHGSAEEVEIRACAVHAVELLSAASGLTAAALDELLWNRGQEPRYKAHPRHRSRCTAY